MHISYIACTRLVITEENYNSIIITENGFFDSFSIQDDSSQQSFTACA